MHVVILCGGRGMRLNGGLAPKALAEVKDKPMVDHVMHVYDKLNDVQFHLLLGSLADSIRLNFLLHPCSRTSLYDTGKNATTGDRLRQWLDVIEPKSTFAVAYCDCLIDIDIRHVYDLHREHGKLATLVAVPAISSKGVLKIESIRQIGLVTSFAEKPKTDTWTNFGYFLFEPGILDRMVQVFEISLETGLLPRLAQAGELVAYKHEGNHIAVDSPRELEEANTLEWIK
jgi:glucose-1-phosphate cytidylyltransferase